MLAALVVLVAAACGGDPLSGEAPDGGPAAETYRNDDYGFSLTYDTRLTQTTAGEGGDTGAVFDISFVDRSGPVAGGAYLDGVKVSVFELPREIREGDVARLKDQLQGVVDERLASLPSGRLIESLTRTTVNGTPGFTVTYSFAQDGATVTARSTFLFAGTRQYEVTGQASEADWAQLSPTLEAAMASFTVD